MNFVRTIQQRLNQIKSLSIYDFELIKERMTDWAQLQHYEQANAELIGNDNGVVFFGDSITDYWDLSTYFLHQSYINRGISGQTTPQMLIRFRPDAIALDPKAVVVLAGINDIGSNTALNQIQDNLQSIAELAKCNQIQMIFASVLPVSETMSVTRPLHKIQALNDWIKQYCADNNCV